MSLFFAAADAYSTALCEYFTVANANTFYHWKNEANMSNIFQKHVGSFQSVLQQLSKHFKQ